MFYALATHHEFWKKRLNLFVALAPVVNLSNSDSLFFKFISKTKLDSLAIWFVKTFGSTELFRLGTKTDGGSFCNLIPGCKMSMRFIDNVLNPYDNSDVGAASNGHYPNGSSLNQLLHFS